MQIGEEQHVYILEPDGTPVPPLDEPDDPPETDEDSEPDTTQHLSPI